MKHIIIAGVPRSGKTTLCHKLSLSHKYEHFAMDSIVMAFDQAFPEIGVLHTDCWDFIETSEIFIQFMKKISMTDNYDKFDCGIAFDLYHITPKDFYENIDRKYCDIIFLGYPHISIEEKFNQIRTFDTKYDWTNERDDELVKKHVKDYIDISKWLQNECKKYNLCFIDVSEKREQVINKLLEKILNK